MSYFSSEQLKPMKRKKWGSHSILDFYLLREYLFPFTVLIVGFVLLFVIGDLCNDLSDFLDNDASLGKLTLFLACRLPGNIRFILPLSVLLATMYTMAHLGKNHEITAIRASGVSLLRCCGSIFIFALMITGLNFWFNEKIVPYTARKAEIIKDRASGEDARINTVNMLSYRSGDGLRTWFFKNFHLEGVNQNVALKKFRTSESNRLEWDMKAGEAEFFPDRGWEFRNVTLTRYGDVSFLPSPPENIEILNKTLGEIPETPKEIMDMVKPPEELSSFDILHLLRQNTNMPDKLRGVYKTIFYHRIAFPWSCFLAVFLGIPLAARNERRGVMTAIVIAVVVIAVYQITSEAFIIFGKRQWLPPAIAGLGPTIAFILYGWYNVRRQY